MTARREFLKVASMAPLGALNMPLVGSTEQNQTSPTTGEADKSDHLRRLPSPPNPTVKDFQNYDLLGKPEEEGQLFGPTRPGNWISVKENLLTALGSAVRSDDPIHKWLGTFSETIEDRTAEIVMRSVSLLTRPDKSPELRYEPQLYDLVLRGAATQLDRCLQYRNEMGGYEISGIRSGIAYLTFLKLKPVQRNIILQSSSSDLEGILKATEARSSEYFERASRGFSGAFEKYHMLGLQSDADGAAIESGVAESKESLRTALLEKQLNLQAEAQLAEFTRMLTPGTSANSAERYLRLLAMLSEDLSDVYCKLYSSAKGTKQVLKLQELSVLSKITENKIPIDIPAFSSREALNSWIRKVVPDQGEQRRPDVIDGLVIWCRALMRELDLRSQYETEFTLAIPLSQPTGSHTTPIVPASDINSAFTQKNPTGQVTFTLGIKALPLAMQQLSLRLIAIGVSVERSKDDASPVQYASDFENAAPYPAVNAGTTPGYDKTPPSGQVKSVRQFERAKMARLNGVLVSPQQSISCEDIAFFKVCRSYQRPKIFLTNIRIQGGYIGDLEPILNYDLACHNLDPFGTWTLQLDPVAIEYWASSHVLNDSWISGLILHLRLRGPAQ